MLATPGSAVTQLLVLHHAILPCDYAQIANRWATAAAAAYTATTRRGQLTPLPFARLGFGIDVHGLNARLADQSRQSGRRHCARVRALESSAAFH